MGGKILISCEQATAICDKNQYKEASLWNKIRLNIHIMMCRYCKTYSSQNRILSIIIGKHLDPCHDSNKLPAKEKQVLEKKLIEKMNE